MTEQLRTLMQSIGSNAEAGDAASVSKQLAELISNLPAIFEQDDLQLLQALHNLSALTYGAEPALTKRLLQRVVDGKAQVIGSDSESTLTTQNVLAMFLLQEKDFARGLPLLNEVMTQRIKLLGVGHPATLRTMNNFAMATATAGHLKEAIGLATTVLNARRTVLGPEAGETLTSLNNLAELYAMAGDRSRAIKTFKELKAIVKRVGPVGSFDVAEVQSRIDKLR